MTCTRCGSDDHNLSGCKWPSAKPHLMKHRRLWYCGTFRGGAYAGGWSLGSVGVGYEAADAYSDWAALNKIDKLEAYTCELSLE